MEERKLNISKVIITIVSAILLVVIVAVLSKFLTNKKQATVVTSDAQTNVENHEKVASEHDNTWKVTNMNMPNNTVKIENNQNSETSGENNNSQKNETNSTNNNSQLDENITNNDNLQNNNVTQNNNDANEEKRKSNNGVIWLTFDDGPSANITPKVLDILKNENVKATFFVINYSDKNEELIKRIVAEGHTIGIHGYSHEYSKLYKSKEAFINNITKLQDKIYNSTGVKSMYIRFPGGSSNTVSRRYCKGIMTVLTKEMLEKGYKYYDWNISSGDAGGAKTANAVYKNVTKNLSKKRGNMVLMHDFGSNKKGLEALPEIIKYAKKQGYTFSAIDDDTPMFAQHVNN